MQTSGSSGRMANVSMEHILAWNPQAIATQDADFARRARTVPEWRETDAVRHGRVWCAPSLPYGWLGGPPGVNRLIGVRWLAEKLYPQHPAVRARPPMADEVAHFYRLFYGVQLDAKDVQQLLTIGT